MARSIIAVCPSCARQFNHTPDPDQPVASCPACGRTFRISADAPASAALGAPGFREGEEAFGPYALIQQIGANDIGVLYRARDTRTGAIVALKVMAAGSSDSRLDLERLARRARAAMKLSNPGIARILEVDICDGLWYIARDYVNGRPMSDLLADGSLSANEGIMLVHAACEALGYAHAEGVLHRNLKPSNIIIDDMGNPVLTEFGLGRDPLHVMGSVPAILGGGAAQVFDLPRYLPPERAAGRRSTARSDIYSMGAILYQLVTAHPPFESGHLLTLMARIAHGGPQPPRAIAPNTSEYLERIIMTAMRVQPELRYSSMSMLVRDLDRFMAGEPAPPSPGPVRRLVRLAFRHQFVTLPLAVIIALLCAWLMLTYYANQKRLISDASGENDRGVECLRTEHFEEALKAFDQAWQKADGLPAAEKAKIQYGMAVALAGRGEGEKALQHFDDAAVWLGDTNLLARRGAVKYGQQRFAEAEEDFKKAAELVGQAADASVRQRQHEFLYYLGMAKWSAGHLSEGRRLIADAAKQAPGKMRYSDMLAIIEADIDRRPRTSAKPLKAVQVTPIDDDEPVDFTAPAVQKPVKKTIKKPADDDDIPEDVIIPKDKK
jgi:tetratricopeptide (TPR) repeat protein